MSRILYKCKVFYEENVMHMMFDFRLFGVLFVVAAALHMVWMKFFGDAYCAQARACGGAKDGGSCELPCCWACFLGKCALFVAGFVLFVVPQLGMGMMSDLWCGALWGLILGGFHNLCNKSMLCSWGWEMVARDTAWCGAMGATLAFLTMHLRALLGA
jgi:uncharacterized membrane protein